MSLYLDQTRTPSKVRQTTKQMHHAHLQHPLAADGHYPVSLSQLSASLLVVSYSNTHLYTATTLLQMRTLSLESIDNQQEVE